MNMPPDHGWNDSAEERELDRILTRLPDIPVSNHFTSRVLNEVRSVDRAVNRSARFTWGGWIRGFYLPNPLRLAIAFCLLLAVVWGGRARWEAHRRAQLAESLSTVTALAGVPSVDALRDFEAIIRLDELHPVPDLPAADLELLAALQ